MESGLNRYGPALSFAPEVSNRSTDQSNRSANALSSYLGVFTHSPGAKEVPCFALLKE